MKIKIPGMPKADQGFLLKGLPKPDGDPDNANHSSGEHPATIPDRHPLDFHSQTACEAGDGKIKIPGMPKADQWVLLIKDRI